MSAEGTKVGELRRGGEKRDAIHIAVAPAVAAERLFAGQKVGLIKGDNDKYFTGRAKTMIGIVDPFLDHAVEAGDQFWVFLFPNTITGLNHVWTHPAFTETPAVAPLKLESVEEVTEKLVAYVEEKILKVQPNPADKQASEDWLRGFCAMSNCPDYDRVVAAALGDHHLNDDGYGHSGVQNYGGDEWYLHFNGSDAHGEIPPEFWDHLEIVTGRKAPQRAKYFSCSC